MQRLRCRRKRTVSVTVQSSRRATARVQQVAIWQLARSQCKTSGLSSMRLTKIVGVSFPTVFKSKVQCRHRNNIMGGLSTLLKHLLLRVSLGSVSSCSEINGEQCVKKAANSLTGRSQWQHPELPPATCPAGQKNESQVCLRHCRVC